MASALNPNDKPSYLRYVKRTTYSREFQLYVRGEKRTQGFSRANRQYLVSLANADWFEDHVRKTDHNKSLAQIDEKAIRARGALTLPATGYRARYRNSGETCRCCRYRAYTGSSRRDQRQWNSRI